MKPFFCYLLPFVHVGPRWLYISNEKRGVFSVVAFLLKHLWRTPSTKPRFVPQHGHLQNHDTHPSSSTELSLVFAGNHGVETQMHSLTFLKMVMLVPVTFINCVTHFKGCKVKKDKKNDPLHHLLQAYAILYSFTHIALQGIFPQVSCQASWRRCFVWGVCSVEALYAMVAATFRNQTSGGQTNYIYITCGTYTIQEKGHGASSLPLQQHSLSCGRIVFWNMSHSNVRKKERFHNATMVLLVCCSCLMYIMFLWNPCWE